MKKEWFFLIEGHGLFAPRQLRPCCQLCLHCIGSCKLNPGERSGSVHTHPWFTLTAATEMETQIFFSIKIGLHWTLWKCSHGDLRQGQCQPKGPNTIHSFRWRCRSQCKGSFTLWQRKVFYFFLQEWVTLVFMEVFTWRPVAKATTTVSSSMATTLSSIGFYAQLRRQRQWQNFLYLCGSQYERALNEP